MSYMYCKMLNGMKYSLFSALWMLQLFTVQQLAGQNIQLSFSTAPPACNGYTDGTVTVTATGGTAPYAYLWNNGQSGQTNFGVGAGIVSVTVTDQGGQTATGSTTVGQPAQIVAAITPTGVHCLNGGGTVNGSATGGTPPYTYLWGNGATSASLPITSAGAYLLTVTDANGCSDLESYFVHPPLAVTVEVQDIPCFMFCDGVAWAVVTGGTPPYSYIWSNGATTQQIVNLMPGCYSVIVTDAAGCSIGDSACIYEPPAITINFNTVTPACGGSTGSVTAQASGGTPPFTYLWSHNNVVGPTLSNVPAGTYFVQVTDANGCQESKPVGIPTGTGLNVSLSIQKAACLGVNDGIVTAIVTPATAGPYSYQWNVQSVNAATLNGIAANTPVCVTVTDTNTGCQGIACDIVGTHGTLGLQVTDTDVSCAADLTGTATASAFNGTAPYTYTWTLPGGATTNGPSISGLGTGAYSVQVTDDRGCTAVSVADIGVVSTLNAAYEISLVECVGASLQVRFVDKSVNPGSVIVAWNWNIVWGNGGSIQSNQQNPLVNLPANETGTAQLTVTSAAGCTDFVSAPFSVDALPNVQIDVNSPAFNCDGSPVRINVTGDPSYTYSWFPTAGLIFDPGPQSVLANPAQTQIYTLIASNGSCADTVEVEVIRQTPLALSVGAHEVFPCASTATLTATVNVNASVQWFDVNGVPVATGTTITVPASAVPTKYRVVATDALGCIRTDSVTVTGKEVSIALNVPAEVFNCNNGPIPINVVGAPANTYTWSPMTGLTFPNPNSPNIIANPAVTTDYQLIATNGFCSDTAQVKVTRVPPIELAVQNPTVTSCEANATLEAEINAASNAEVKWEPTQETTMTITVPATSTPTTYIVVATDSYGCTQSATATVVGRAAEVAITANTPTSVCEDQSVLLSATNQNPTDLLTYQWSATPALTITPNNAANTTISGAAGTYAVTLAATNQYGCTDTQQVSVTFQTAGSTVGDVQIKNCGGLTVDFQVPNTVSGTWDFGDGQTSTASNPSHTYAAVGPYTVTFTPSGAADCVTPFDTLLIVQADPVVVASITSNQVSCAEVAVYNFVGQPIGLGYSWQWVIDGHASAEQSPTLTFSQAGPVNVGLVVLDANGCSDTADLSLDVDLINESIGNTATICAGGSVKLNPDFNPNYTYLWSASPSDPTLDVNSPNPSVTPTAATTTYTLQVSNGNCTAQYETQVSLQATALLDVGSDLKVCSDDPVTLTVLNPTPGANYQWSQTENFNIILAEGSSVQVIPEKNGVYYVRSVQAGCTSLGSVRVNNAEVNIDALGKNRSLCLGESTELTVTNIDPDDNLQFIWTPTLDPISNPTVSPTSNTAYSVIIVNQLDCRDTVAFQVNVVELAVTAEVTGKDTICPGESTTLLATATGTGTVFTYAWTPAATLSEANIANPTARPDATTVYTVTATADGLCPNTASVTVFFQGDQCIEPYIFVPKAFTPNGDESNDRFIVRGVNIKELYMVVWDRWGEKVYETEDTQALGWDGTYEGASLTPDAYAWYVKATCGNGAVYIKKGNVTLLK